MKKGRIIKTVVSTLLFVVALFMIFNWYDYRMLLLLFTWTWGNNIDQANKG